MTSSMAAEQFDQEGASRLLLLVGNWQAELLQNLLAVIHQVHES